MSHRRYVVLHSSCVMNNNNDNDNENNAGIFNLRPIRCNILNELNVFFSQNSNDRYVHTQCRSTYLQRLLASAIQLVLCLLLHRTRKKSDLHQINDRSWSVGFRNYSSKC